MATQSSVVTYTVTQFAQQAFSDALGIARRGRDLADCAFAAPDLGEYLTSLYRAFRVPYKKAKDAEVKADVTAWANAWHGTTASLIAPFKARGFKITSWPNLRSGDGTVIVKTLTEASEAAKATALEKAERDAKDKLAFDAEQATMLRDKAQAMPLADLVAVILASIQATSHTVTDVLAELGKHTVPTAPTMPTDKAQSVLTGAAKRVKAH